MPSNRARDRPLTVWFDGACPLCVREIGLVRRLAPADAIRFVDVALDGADCPIDRAQLLARFHAQVEDGPLLSGVAAFAAMWRRAPALAPLGWLASRPWLERPFEVAYRAFLRLRPRLQRVARALTEAKGRR